MSRSEILMVGCCHTHTRVAAHLIRTAHVITHLHLILAALLVTKVVHLGGIIGRIVILPVIVRGGIVPVRMPIERIVRFVLVGDRRVTTGRRNRR